ncbi:MAG TPA: extracellular solute-binding protein [Stellaceae bacterium]|nr:extracellular solute-binding protein [Stellaceae bacterium]
MTLTRRGLLKRTALATGALATGALAAGTLAGPFVRGAHAAGKLSAFFWDHPVPSVPPAMRKLCEAWAAKEKVELQVDFVSTNGDKILLTLAAEGQAGSGHDIATIPSWYVSGQVERLEPVDDLIPPLVEQNGKLDWTAEYLGKFNGHWAALPVSTGSPTLPACARIDLMKKHAGIDATEMYPAGAPPNKELADSWNWENFLAAARKCFEAGFPFGLPLGITPDSVDWVGAMFASYGAALVDKDSNITVNSDAVKQVLDWFKRLTPYLPPEVYAWDNASNNRYLIAGKGSLILNPPSAWAVAKRDAPQIAEQLWTFPPPKGPKGRIEAGIPWYWGIWNFSPNKAAAKSLLMFLSERSSVEALVNASRGYDVPLYEKFRDFKIWDEEAPPKGTLHNYPPRGDTVLSIACAPAPPNIANQMYAQGTMTKLVAHCTQQGEPIDKAIAWAEQEIEGFIRR